MDSQQKSYLIFGGWIAYTIFISLFWRNIISYMMGGDILVGAILYTITNPAYLLLGFFIIKTTPIAKWKSTLYSLLLIFSLDLVSSPRVMVEEISSSSMATDFATILIKSLNNWLGLSLNMLWWTVYLIIPILIMFIAMEGLGYTTFIRKIKNGGSL